jgi:hypothetical protein
LGVYRVNPATGTAASEIRALKSICLLLLFLLPKGRREEGRKGLRSH